MIRRLFATWTEACEYLLFLSVCLLGVGAASWLWVPIAAMVLLLLGWPRWQRLFAKAAAVDAEYRELGSLMRPYSSRLAWDLYLKGHKLALVLIAKFAQDCLFLGAAFMFGHGIAWLWSV